MCTTCMSSETINSNLNKLTKFEQSEIWNYFDRGIYYLGELSAKLNRTQWSEFDNESGFYVVNRGDHICYRYKILRVLGKGSYGQVYMAWDYKTMTKVAIKINRHGSKDRKISIQEIIMHNYLDEWYTEGRKELSRMLDHFQFRGHLCIVMELYWKDLSFELSRRNYKGYKIGQTKKIVRSIIKGLVSLHEVNLIHGDLKMNNVVFFKKHSTDITILDLGNAKFDDKSNEAKFAARCYLSPEVILNLGYGPEVDIWAVAVTAYEIATGKILFKGENQKDQLIRMMEVLGVPPEKMIRSSIMADEHFHKNNCPKYCSIQRSNKIQLLKIGKSPSHKKRLLPGHSKVFFELKKRSTLFVDFLQKCLKWDPAERMTAREALSHRWLLEECSVIKRVPEVIPDKIGISISSHSMLRRELQDFPNNVLPAQLHHYRQPIRRTLSMIDTRDQMLTAYGKWTFVRSKYLIMLNESKKTESKQ